MLIHPAIYIKQSLKEGRGVFTRDAIDKNTVIEVAPVLVLPEKERKWIDKSVLYNYYFLWGHDDKLTAICLGYGSVYNHSYNPNTIYEADYENDIITFITLRKIKAGEELLVNYNYEPDSQKPVWFDVK
jgi:SET domain-containing protein